MALELTPAELVRLVQALNSVPDGLCVVNDRDELALWENDAATRSLAEKVRREGERPDVAEHINTHYGKGKQ